MLCEIYWQENVVFICDMINRIESHVVNIDFELKTKRGDKYFCFTSFLNLKNLFISLQPDCPIKMGFH